MIDRKKLYLHSRFLCIYLFIYLLLLLLLLLFFFFFSVVVKAKNRFIRHKQAFTEPRLENRSAGVAHS